MSHCANGYVDKGSPEPSCRRLLVPTSTTSVNHPIATNMQQLTLPLPIDPRILELLADEPYAQWGIERSE